MRLWDKDDGNLLRVYIGAQSTIYSLAFSPDGKYLAAAGHTINVNISFSNIYSMLLIL